jgi:glycosyltransferase 2 family protein
MVAQTLLNRFTPANTGGMALRARYLQKRGVDLPGAAASVGLTSAADAVAQVVLLVLFASWAGSTGELGFELPAVDTLVLALVVVLAVAGVVLLTPWSRRVVFGPVRTTVTRIVTELLLLARQPMKLTLLLSGAMLAKLLTIAAFVLACRSFGIGEPLAQLCLLYMTANTVASAAPTPGGIGAVEAALVAVLTGLGVPAPTALSTVLIFRLLTYWLPVLPSVAALHHLRRLETV